MTLRRSKVLAVRRGHNGHIVVNAFKIIKTLELGYG